VCAIALACGTHSEHEAASDVVPPTAYSPGNARESAAVYAAVIADILSKNPGRAVLDPETSLRDISGDLWSEADRRVQEDPLIDATLWRALVPLNAQPQSLDLAALAAVLPDVIQARSDQQEALADAGYSGPKFGEAFPGAHSAVRVSAVAFSPDERIAVVYVSLHCGGLCGEGAVYSLALSGTTWQITQYLSLWTA
jgi:hypothetical protein